MLQIKKSFYFIGLLLLWLPLVAGAAPRTAAVAMPDTYAADASRQVLLDGGNAVDAAISAVFTLAVTLPEAGNIGGGGFMVAHMGDESVFLDFREKAPLASDRDMYLDRDGNFVQRRSLVGALAVGVPGTVRGMQVAHKRFGSLPWARLMQPAIDLARNGFKVPDALAAMRDELLQRFGDDTNFSQYFATMDGGTVFRQPELAATLERLAHDPEDFYTGSIADQIVAQMRSSGGLISHRDLAEYRAVWRSPLLSQWRDYTLVSTPPPSSGGIALAQLLAMHDAAGEHFRGVAHNSARYLHLLAEIEKRVFADRGDYLGDPDFGDVPVAQLIDPDYLIRRASTINPVAISYGVRPGLSSDSSAPASDDSPDTTHFSIVDGDGNALALTYTMNWEFGSGVVVSGAGFLLNDEMDDFSAKAGVPNAFGVIGSDKNAIAPGKRMLSSMSPTLLLRDGHPVVVVGTPGGSTIFTSVFQVILNIFDFHMTAASAVAATRFHHQLPAASVIRHDPGRPVEASVVEDLKDLGYALQANAWGPLGNVMLVRRTEAGELQAAADPRGRGEADVVVLEKAASARAVAGS